MTRRGRILANKPVKICGNPLSPRHPRPIAVTFNGNLPLLKEEAALEMCPDFGFFNRFLRTRERHGRNDGRAEFNDSSEQTSLRFKPPAHPISRLIYFH